MVELADELDTLVSIFSAMGGVPRELLLELDRVRVGGSGIGIGRAKLGEKKDEDEDAGTRALLCPSVACGTEEDGVNNAACGFNDFKLLPSFVVVFVGWKTWPLVEVLDEEKEGGGRDGIGADSRSRSEGILVAADEEATSEGAANERR